MKIPSWHAGSCMDQLAGRISVLGLECCRVMMSQKIPYVTVLVTGCAHYLGSFFNRNNKSPQTNSLPSRYLFLNLHQCDVQITYTRTHDETYTTQICQQNCYHPVKLQTLSTILRCPLCNNLQIIYHCADMDRTLSIYDNNI